MVGSLGHPRPLRPESRTDPSGTVSYRDWVAEVVNRYKDDPTILAWQLVNEAEVKPGRDTGCSTNAAGILKSFAADVSGLVKSIDPNHLVSLGTMGGGQCGAQGSEYEDVHSVPTIDLCEYHDYQPNAAMPGDQWNGLQVRIDQCQALNKPLFVERRGSSQTMLEARFKPAPTGSTPSSAPSSRPVSSGSWSGPGVRLAPDSTTTMSGPATRFSECWLPTRARPATRGPRLRRPRGFPWCPRYRPCVSPDRTHRSPLSYGSCASPAQVSPNVTVGTPDANGAQPNSAGFVQFGVQINTSPTPNNVLIAAEITDVRCKRPRPPGGRQQRRRFRLHR